MPSSDARPPVSGAPAATDPPAAVPAEAEVRHEHVVVKKTLVMVNGASAVAARLLNIFVLVWMYQYLLGHVTPEEFAVYPVVMALMVFAPLFFSFFTGGVSRYVVAAYAEGDKGRVVEIVSSIMPLLALAAAAFLLIGFGFAAVIGDVLTIAPEMTHDARLMLSLLVVSFAAQMCLLPFGVGFHVRQRFVELNVLWLARDVLRIILMFALIGVAGPAVLWVVVAAVAADLVYVVAVTIRSRQLVPALRFRRSAVHLRTARTLVSFGLWTTLGRLAGLMYVPGAVLVLNRYGSAVDVTNFYFGAALFQHVQSMIAFAREPLQPSLVAMHTLEDRQRLARATLTGGRYGLWAAMIVACPLAIFSTDLISLMMEPTYAGAALVLMLLMAILPFGQAAGLLPMIAVAKAEVRTFNTAAFVATFLALAGTAVATAGFGLGAAGAAAALLIVTAGAQILYFWPLNLHLSEVSAPDFVRDVLWRGLLPALAGSAVWLTLALTVPLDGWFALGAAAAAGGLVYVAVLFGPCLGDADRQLVLSLVRRFRGSVGRARFA